MEANTATGVSKCYVFKSQLQEYAQKAGLNTPVYETIKEGPSHVPSFRSTVILNDNRYESLPGFFHRKAAEQSAAEVALMQLAKSGEVKECISQPVHETGLCKNLLQEYAQKMNYAIPLYECRRDEGPVKPNRASIYSCSVEIAGIRYIGGPAKTKKEAEIKAARTALLAIKSGASESSWKPPNENSQLTVVPSKKREPERVHNSDVVPDALKPKKGRFKKKPKKKIFRDKVNTRVKNAGDMEIKEDGNMEPQAGHDSLLEATGNSPSEISNTVNPSAGETSVLQDILTSPSNGNFQEGHPTASNHNQINDGTSAIGIPSLSCGDPAAFGNEVNPIVGEIAANNSATAQI